MTGLHRSDDLCSVSNLDVEVFAVVHALHEVVHEILSGVGGSYQKNVSTSI